MRLSGRSRRESDVQVFCAAGFAEEAVDVMKCSSWHHASGQARQAGGYRQPIKSEAFGEC